MRIRFRASDFGLVLKVKLSCKIEKGFLCDYARVIFFFARVIQQLDFRTQNVQANVLPPAPRRAHFARRWSRAFKPTIRLFTWSFF